MKICVWPCFQGDLGTRPEDVFCVNDFFNQLHHTDVYNALTIHGLAVADQLPSSVLDIAHFWQVTAYNIGGLVYSLDDIEHGVLRGE